MAETDWQQAHDDLRAAVEALADEWETRAGAGIGTLSDAVVDLRALLATPAPEAAREGEHTITLTTEPTLNAVETMAVAVLDDGSEIRMRNFGDRAEIRTWDKAKSCNPPRLLVDLLAGRHVIDVRPATDLPTTVQADRDAGPPNVLPTEEDREPGQVRLTDEERLEIDQTAAEHDYPTETDDGIVMRCRCGATPPSHYLGQQVEEGLWLWEHHRREQHAAVERILAARLLVGERCGHPNACPHERHGYVPGSAFPIDDAKSDLDRMARILMTAWEEAEKARVGVTYVASFVDMAHAVLAARQSDPDATERVEWGVRGVLPEPDPEMVWQFPTEMGARATARHQKYGGRIVRRTVTTGEWTEVSE